MTYFTFLLIFVVGPIVLMAVVPRPELGASGRRAIWAIPMIALIAFFYTTPWDNYLVYNGVWFYGPDRVIGTIGYVPIEEYGFFLLQPVLTGLLCYHIYSRNKVTLKGHCTRRRIDAIFLLYALGFFLGVVCLAAGGSGTYMGLILSWACPVLALLWYAGSPLFRANGRAFALSVWTPTLYLWACDIFAMRSGIWTISDDTSFDIDPLGLPVEEAMFFLVTNLLVVQGVILIAFGDRLPMPFTETSSQRP